MTRARNTADTQTASGGPVSPSIAGKNKIINGNMNIWQRGTTFTPTATGYFYTTDRWVGYCYSSSTVTISQQAFTAGTAPETGYESQYFLRVNSTNTLNLLQQNIEDVRTLAGQTVTVSFWAKSASAQTLTIYLSQSFGTGGSAGVDNTATKAITTSWARYSVNITLPSIAGKTIGANSFLANTFTGAINNALDIWGVQVEAGPTATPFQTATGTIQGELAACQRYYYRSLSTDSQYQTHGTGFCWSTASAMVFHRVPVTMRIAPTTLDYGNLLLLDSGFSGGGTQTLVFASSENSANMVQIMTTNATGLTAYRPVYLRNNNTTAGYIGFSAEL
jgi:hypothetical protein